VKSPLFRYTTGVLDELNVVGERLHASGWAVSLEGIPITEMRVAIDGLAVGSAFTSTLPSPDVRSALPGLAGTESCRFAIDVGLSEAQMRKLSEGAVISLAPWAGDVPGIGWDRVWRFRMPRPTAEESMNVGLGDFTVTSFSFLSLFRLVASLRPGESVLDAGCGLGRMAFALAHYLGRDGRYEGFDISDAFIDDARKRFGSLPNFTFRKVDVYNKHYNPRGKLRASDFAFPYGDDSFGFVVLTSVFTHMLKAEVVNYLKQTRRVLREDGRCFATFFILDDEAEALIRDGRSSIDIRHQMPDGTRVQQPKLPEAAVAYREADLREMVKEAGFEIAQLHRGQWPGRERFLTYQDVCLLEPVS
jgi:SAM-dependent methyltransferase